MFSADRSHSPMEVCLFIEHLYLTPRNSTSWCMKNCTKLDFWWSHNILLVVEPDSMTMGWKLVFISSRSATLSIFSRIWKDEAEDRHKFKSIFDISPLEKASRDGNVRKGERCHESFSLQNWNCTSVSIVNSELCSSDHLWVRILYLAAKWITWYRRNASTLIDLICDQAATKWCKLSLSASPSENPISPQTKKGEISPSKRTKSFVGNFFPRTNLPSHQPSSRLTFLPELYFCSLLITSWRKSWV